ncbi:phosphoenolpyruvate--protein phosphotransferase [Thermococcus sp. PK]|uniref:phosphoenolpyruvate--protein phosphotransferase n=1 Tax=Thermococcus sp. PK TaxID=913025 RepID=UPI000693DEEF|nr:phosphoenolpyruvate--protein phosphotransferase [Thermococcus sp. PK]
MQIIKGIPVSGGMGIGEAIVIQPVIQTTTEITGEDAKSAILNAKKNTIELLDEFIAREPPEVADILKAHKLMVDAIVSEALEEVEKGRGAVAAINSVIDKYVKLLTASGSSLIQLRVNDLIDIKNTLLENLTQKNIEHVKKGSIIVIKEIQPSQLLRYKNQGIAGIVSERGSYTSHVAIIARNLGIPAIFGAKNVTELVKNGDLIIVDGFSGEVLINPDKNTVELYNAKKKTFTKLIQLFERAKDKHAITTDGYKVLVTANIGSEDDLNTALINGCDGVGLFRTEFYYLSRQTLPSSEEFSRILEKLANKLEEKPLTIRLLDVGGDKPLPYLSSPKENNPFLGLRGIRYLLKYRGLLKSQLQAIVMASSKQKNIRVMAPMVSTIEEIRLLKEEIKKISPKAKENIEFGIMVEVPSTLFLLDKIIKEVDFLSIGTNDLTQYLFAVDRTNEEVSHIYDDMHPAVLRAISEITKHAQKKRIPVDVCGELASNPLAVPILVGLGINELSVSPTSIPLIKWIIQNIPLERSKRLAKEVLTLENGQEVREKVREFLKEYLGENIPW